MDIAISLFKAVLGYFILMFISTNLIGMIVRGLIKSRSINDQPVEDITKPKSILITFLFFIFTIAYLYALLKFWNWGVTLVALILVISRIPDLIFEIKTGHKITLKTMHQRPIDIFCNIIGWLALPLLWYSLNYL